MLFGYTVVKVWNQYNDIAQSLCFSCITFDTHNCVSRFAPEADWEDNENLDKVCFLQ